MGIGEAVLYTAAVLGIASSLVILVPVIIAWFAGRWPAAKRTLAVRSAAASAPPIARPNPPDALPDLRRLALPVAVAVPLSFSEALRLYALLGFFGLFFVIAALAMTTSILSWVGIMHFADDPNADGGGTAAGNWLDKILWVAMPLLFCGTAIAHEIATTGTLLSPMNVFACYLFYRISEMYWPEPIARSC